MIRIRTGRNGKKFVAWVGLGLMVAGVGFTLRPVYHLVRRQCLELWTAYEWRHRISSPIPSSGRAVAWLFSKDVDLNSPVLWNGTEENLNKFPCMSMRGVLPGSPGTVIIQGHRDAHFRKLAHFKPGDTLCLETLSKEKLHYTAAWVDVLSIVEMEEKLRDPYRFQGLVLATCYPFRFAGPAPQRYLVWFREVRRDSPEWPVKSVENVLDRAEKSRVVCEFNHHQD